MYCKHCGNQIENDSKFCSFCGTKQELIGQIDQTQQSFSHANVDKNTVEDIDGNVYRTVQIGNQVWMASNLKVTKYRNGDPIPNILDKMEWGNLETGAWCNYDNAQKNGIIYGKLYNWYAVNDKRTLAPPGWRVADYLDWETLVKFLGGKSIAGVKLHEKTSNYSDSTDRQATNESGFSGLSCGCRSSDGSFKSLDEVAYWWSSSEDRLPFDKGEVYAFNYQIYFKESFDYRGLPKSMGSYVRCIRDSDVCNEVPKLQKESNSNIADKLSALEAYNELQANCNFIEQSVKKQLPHKGRVNLLIFNLCALISILDENFDNGREDFFNEFIDIIKSNISLDLNISTNESGNYIGKKMDDYNTLMKVLVDKDPIKAKTLELDFYLTELEIEHSYRFRLSLAYLTNLFVKIADSI